MNKPFRGWKITFFEGGIHVPYFMRWAGKIEPGTVYEEPVHHFDIYASAAAAAGANLPDDRVMDGTNLLPFISEDTHGKLAQGKAHERLFWREGDYHVVLADGWKLQRTKRPDKIWLFNMTEDPTEQHNVAAEQADRVQLMLAMLEKHNAEQVESVWPALIESGRRIDKTGGDKPEVGDEHIYWAN